MMVDIVDALNSRTVFEVTTVEILPPKTKEEEETIRQKWTDELLQAEVAGDTEFIMMYSSARQSITETAEYRQLDYDAILKSDDLAAMETLLEQQTEVQA
ncbi:unnamed protein product, partial [Cyprideis torosa]